MNKLSSQVPHINHDYYDIGGIRVERFSSAENTTLKHPPIVCVHGGCHASWAWTQHAHVYATYGYEVHALNWRGRGGSSDVDVASFVRMSLVDVADDISTVVDDLASSPILIGHSMGALAAQRFASANPTCALALLTPVVPSNISASPIELIIDDMREPWGPPPPEVARQLFFQGVSDAQAADFSRRLVPESPLRVYEATRWSVSVDTDKIEAPILVVSGALDVLTPHETGASLARLYDAEYILEPDYGHNMLLGDGAERIAFHVLHWLSGLSRRNE
jgi:pimeloyl-ACP methyl ester carboxylesterase